MRLVQEFALKNGLKYIETSAKENTNIEKIFKELSNSVLNTP